MKQEYIKAICKKLEECESLSLIDLIWQILVKSERQVV